MNIQILDSWLREHLETKATAKEIAEKLSLTSVSIERVESHGDDFLYDIEVTTNRPDLASVVGLAREAGAVLPQFGVDAKFIPPTLTRPKHASQGVPITITNNDQLIHRICAVVLEVQLAKTPQIIRERLEAAGMRSLNNVIDITNYVMRTMGHPAHVFDYDRLTEHTLRIRESRPGETIVTLDDKAYSLPGGDIIAEDGTGRIVDLIGIMGLKNSVVTDDTKRIVFFIDNNDANKIRQTSMNLGIRTEAAQLNEKGIDPGLALDTLLYGIKMYEDLASAKLLSDVIDIYPTKQHEKAVTLTEEKIHKVIGVPIPLQKAVEILTTLGFDVTTRNNQLSAKVPSFRLQDVAIPEDLIEEIARVYGYHNIPATLPPITPAPVPLETNQFYWEKRIKDMLKYWGFTEVFTYSMVSEEMYEGDLEDAVTIQNPLSDDLVYMRSTLIISLLKVLSENKHRDTIKIFELANVYYQQSPNLPAEKRVLAAVIKKPHITYFHAKGYIEQLTKDLGIRDVTYRISEQTANGASIFVKTTYLGEIEVLDANVVNFEIDFDTLLTYASLQKIYTPLSKHPPVIEDLAFIIAQHHLTADIIATIKNQSPFITEVSLLDRYRDSRTFHILYQNPTRNLTNEDVSQIRKEIIGTLKEKFDATLKE